MLHQHRIIETDPLQSQKAGQAFGRIAGHIAGNIGHASRMNNFIELALPKTLDTSTADIIEDFFVPMLAHATRYDRGVGFFSAGWLRMTAAGMVAFARNRPILSEEDWQNSPGLEL